MTSKYVAKGALRTAKNYAKGYTDIQAKVREATSNDPWGPVGSQMAEIASATYNPQEFHEIMEMLDKRLNDSGKNWRHVFKALTVLQYCLHSGSDHVVNYARENLYIIKTLKEFQFIDPETGKDHGASVREKSKIISALLADDNRLKEERKTQSNLRDRMASGAIGNDSFSSGRRPESRGGAGGYNNYEEQQQLERAIEESKRSAEEHARRMRDSEREDPEFRKALEISERETHKPKADAVDLWGAAEEHDQKQSDLDFFGSITQPQPVQRQQQDPFGFTNNNSNFFQPAPAQQMQPFGQESSAMFNSAQPFGHSTMTASYGQQMSSTSMGGPSNMGGNPFGAQSSATSNPFAAQQQQPFGQAQTSTPFGQGSSAFNAPASQPQITYSQPSGVGASSAVFGSAFDGGAGQKSYIPSSSATNPNAQMAHIARNAIQIDPFASLAAGGSQASGSKSPFTSTMSSNNMMGNQNSMMGRSSPFNTSNGNLTSLQPTTSVFPSSSNTAGTTSVFNPPPNNPFNRTASSNQNNAADPFASLAPLAKANPTLTSTLGGGSSNNNSFGMGSMGNQAPMGGPAYKPTSGANQFGMGMGGGGMMGGSGAGGALPGFGATNPMLQQQSMQQPQQGFGGGSNSGAFGSPMMGGRAPQQQQQPFQQQNSFF